MWLPRPALFIISPMPVLFIAPAHFALCVYHLLVEIRCVEHVFANLNRAHEAAYMPLVILRAAKEVVGCWYKETC